MRRGKGGGLRVGETLDFWRIEAVEAGRLLRLRAEMKLPGKAWLQFRVEPQGANRSELIQTALFEPKGLAGVLYWYLLCPAHSLIFGRTIQRIAEWAEEAGSRLQKGGGKKSVACLSFPGGRCPRLPKGAWKNAWGERVGGTVSANLGII